MRIGAVVALAAGHRIATLLFHVSPHDPAVFVVVALTLVLVALVAGAFPAWRATRVDPASALRSE